MNNKFLTLEELQYIYEYTIDNYTYDEPLDPFNTANFNKLESALYSPKRQYFNVTLYPTLEIQASVLFYEIIKLHPFINGNKRVACVALLTFLAINEFWINMKWEVLYELAKNVAASDSQDRNMIQEEIVQIIKNNINRISLENFISGLQ